MKIQKSNRGGFIILLVLLSVLFNSAAGCSGPAENKDETKGACYTNSYDNLFITLLNKKNLKLSQK